MAFYLCSRSIMPAKAEALANELLRSFTSTPGDGAACVGVSLPGDGWLPTYIRSVFRFWRAIDLNLLLPGA